MKRPKEGSRYVAHIRYNEQHDMWTVRITDSYAYRKSDMLKVHKEFWSKAQAIKFMQKYI